MQYQVIESQQALDEFVAKISTAKVLAVDTEFMRRRTLYPEIALLQIFDGSHLALIDPLIEMDFQSLWALFANTDILKVLHSPSEDIEVFLKFAGFIPSPIFDTQFALQLLGEGSCIGFANMVKQLSNVDIDKSESRTDWLRRPLTQKQLDYAASDVFHLLPCFQQILNQIEEKQLFSIVLKESELLAQKRSFRQPDPLLYLDIKNVWQLKPRDLAILKELAAWRRAKAEKKNLALNFVLKEHNMVEIAKRRPSTLGSLRNVPGVEPMEVNRSGKEILACIEKGKQIVEQDCPQRVKRLIDFKGYKAACKEIKLIITEVAKENQIPADVFASKKQINQVISWSWKKSEAEKKLLMKPDLALGWRAELLEDRLKNWW
ncbi:ribonuclease D [Pseudoalteromonas peptidolytica]|uniref:ribonuclease D n=1 Tax=Pseudoalteromonas peptidolytica TaxID=61150 RepID=UPI00116D0D41|nr:ribonuclease D [Pseudoalteromonas peptidolytica]NLR15084.1 ribonuclease D [Pseudoalteromonas peptidolytica]GEK09386.1 ribonuclease D [Pseudoalteromonas peptidolytica]